MKELGPASKEDLLNALSGKSCTYCHDNEGNKIKDCICRDDFDLFMVEELTTHLAKPSESGHREDKD